MRLRDMTPHFFIIMAKTTKTKPNKTNIPASDIWLEKMEKNIMQMTFIVAEVLLLSKTKYFIQSNDYT